MITERQEEQAALHALGLLEGDERVTFESEMARNPEVRALVDSFVESSAAMALMAPQVAPPPQLKQRVLAACATQESAGAAAPAAGEIVPFPWMKVVPWMVAASIAVAATWLGVQNLALRSEVQTLSTERQLAEVAYHMAQNQLSERSLLAENMINDLGQKLRRSEDLARLKVTALASLAGNTAEAKVIAVWDPDQQTGLLTMEKLPATSDEQDYQIWVVDPAYPNPVNGGVFHVGADGKVALAFKPDQPIAKAAAFAISLEKKGGVPKAEGTIVLLGK